MFNKKAQAAMEFLMTYGWAILVVLAAVAALAYFGVLSPDRFLPEQCTLPSGMACLDFNHNGTHFQVAIQNSAGFDMDDFNVTISGCAGSSDVDTLVDGRQEIFNITCDPNAGKFKGDVTVKYINARTNLEHTRTGTIIAQIN